ncbi:MAG: glycosyltransferase family 2 protein [Chloroflexi bacterium]|nr:glycosyltransferase family 2 protein [Chloroflexota bacterium]
MKLIVQIPCYNEEKTLALTLATIPKKIPGVSKVEILIVDDGCTDRTVEVAKGCGVDHIVRNAGNKGLAASFQTGLDACLRLGADVIVNTDGDNQYPQQDIPRLIAPILSGEAEMVIGDRQPHTIAHFSFRKRLLQAVGSWVVRKGSGTTVPDAPSGFRAFSREAAMKLNVITRYTYTLETIIQAGKKNITVAHIPIETNPELRDSRLIRGVWDYVKKSAATIVRMYAMYEPLKIFFYMGGIITVIGLGGVARFLFFFFFEPPATGHIQSLVLSGVLLIIGFQVFLIGLLADLIAANRRLIEDSLYRVKKLELGMYQNAEREQRHVPVRVDESGQHGDDGDDLAKEQREVIVSERL